MRRLRLKIYVPIAIVLIGLGVLGYYTRTGTKEVSEVRVSQILIEPTVIHPGDPIFITVDATSSPVSILWDKQNLPLFTFEGKNRAFVAIDFNDKVLKHTIIAQLKNGKTLTKEIQITPREKIVKPLGIPEKLGGNTPAAATNLINSLANDNKILNSVKTETTTLWSKPFQYPLKTIFITDNYGYDRETVQQTIAHKGTDFRAQIGTEVMAMNKGIVRVARFLDSYGNTVVIDHGLGVQTLYMHMSKLNVKEGETIEQGRVVGLSGDTGYVEAPHLHISVKINSISIDPMTFLRFFIK